MSDGLIHMVCTRCGLEYTKTRKEYPPHKWTSEDVSNFFYRGFSYGECNTCQSLPPATLPKFRLNNHRIL